MTALVRQLVDSIQSLPEIKRELFIRRFLALIEAENRIEHQVGETSQSMFKDIEHLAGILKGGPLDLSTNPKYMEGFGDDSMR